MDTQLPFAWVQEDGSGSLGDDVALLNKRRVTQCALSRVCGVCAEPLGRPVAFVGTEVEVGRNEFHAPPLHVACAHSVAARVPLWQVVTTSGFEFVRPNRGEVETRPTFVPNSLIG